MTASAQELVFAIAHEVGNHLGAIRLQAHLLDEDLGARELAQASVLIDGLAGRSGPLLALLRPLLSDEDDATAGEASWRRVLAGVAQQIVEEGTLGTELVLDPSTGSSRRAPAAAWLHPLLVALVGATVVHAGAPGRVGLALEERPDGVVLWITDDGDEEPIGLDAAARGRPLAVAIAACLLERSGGRVEVGRDAEGTRVGLVFPANAA